MLPGCFCCRLTVCCRIREVVSLWSLFVCTNVGVCEEWQDCMRQTPGSNPMPMGYCNLSGGLWWIVWWIVCRTQITLCLVVGACGRFTTAYCLACLELLKHATLHSVCMGASGQLLGSNAAPLRCLADSQWHWRVVACKQQRCTAQVSCAIAMATDYTSLVVVSTLTVMSAILRELFDGVMPSKCVLMHPTWGE